MAQINIQNQIIDKNNSYDNTCFSWTSSQAVTIIEDKWHYVKHLYTIAHYVLAAILWDRYFFLFKKDWLYNQVHRTNKW